MDKYSLAANQIVVNSEAHVAGDGSMGFVGSGGRLRGEVECQGALAKAKVGGYSQVGGGLRGKIQGYSPASRKRLLDKIARIDFEDERYPLWLGVCVTYGAEGSSDPRRAKEELEGWIKRLERESARRGVAPPCGVWVMEFQERGAVHFHMILGLGYIPYGVLQRHWVQVTGSKEYLQVKFQVLGNSRSMIGYMAKYSAKMVQKEVPGASVEGDEEETDTAPPSAEGAAGAAPSVLDNPTYSAGAEGSGIVEDEEQEGPGRFWGVIRKDRIPWAPLRTLVLPLGRWFWQFKRLGRRKWAGVNGRRQGFSVYVGNADRWFMAACWCVAGGWER